MGFSKLERSSEVLQKKLIHDFNLPIHNNFSQFFFTEVLNKISQKVIIIEQIKREQKLKKKDSLQSFKDESDDND